MSSISRVIRLSAPLLGSLLALGAVEQASPIPATSVMRNGAVGFEVEALVLEPVESGTFAAPGLARWAALAAQGFRVTQSVADHGKLYVLLERVGRSTSETPYIPQGVAANPAAAAELEKVLRLNRPVTVVVAPPDRALQQPVAPASGERRSAESR